MGELSRLLTNLGLAYGLMSKDQFVDLVARYAQEKNLSEEKMMALIENLFEELEITHKRRQARHMYEAYEMKTKAENPDLNDFFTEMHQASSTNNGQNELLEEVKKLRSAVEALVSIMDTKKPTE
jgi:hypothetical protein